MQPELSLFMALGGGLLSFLSPCVLPLVPAYFGSLAGPEVLDHRTRKLRLPVFLHSVFFVLGFSVIFVGLGALAGWAGFNFASQLLARRIAGSLLIVFGAYMLLALRIPWLNFEKRLMPNTGTRSSYLRSLLIGAVFAFAWTPCASPILGGILALALDKATTGQGAWLLSVYSIGLGIPFLALGIAFDFLLPLVRQLNKYSLVVYLVSGLLLITAGILTLTR
jgi:cytochrome c-type biogenesis protein